MQNIFQFLSRAFLGLYFLYSGCLKLISPADALSDLHSAHIPMYKVAFGLIVGIEVFGGLFIILGARVRWAGIFLTLLLVLKVYYFHRHIESRAQLTQLLTVLALIGGVLQVALHGSGRFSLDRS